MDGDTPSNSAATMAMDVVDAMRQFNGGHPTLDDEELRRYIIASPQSQSGSAGDAAGQTLLGNCKPFSTGPSPPSLGNAASGAAALPTLESALAALGEQGRQQLLAILQLANSGTGTYSGSPRQLSNHSGAPSASGSSSLQFPGGTFPSGSSSSQQNPLSLAGKQADNSNLSTSSSGQYESVGSGTNTLPSYYSNAFRSYSAHAPFGGAPGQPSNNASTPASASNSSAKPSPALSAITSHSQQPISYTHPVQSPNTQQQLSTASAPVGTFSQFYQAAHTSQPTHTAFPDHLNFTMSDASAFRSPSGFNGIPGTSSTAFYSENGAGNDNDVLFTPLMSPALTASTQPGPSVGPLPESFANLSTYQHQGKYQQEGPSQGVPPMTIFSPLTSPALRPQGSQGQSRDGVNQYSTTPVTSPPRPRNAHSSANGSGNGNANANGRIRGASKNSAKTRPSPIIRPVNDSSSLNGNSSGSSKSLSRAGSGASSKRSSQPNAFTAIDTSSVPTYRSGHSHSVPASPAYVPSDKTAAAFTSTANGRHAAPQATRLHENIARNAEQNTPSPQQFDLSGVLSNIASLPANQTSTYGGSSFPMSTQQYQAAQYDYQHPTSRTADIMAMSSPVDFNNILSILGQHAFAGPGTSAGSDVPAAQPYALNAFSQMTPAETASLDFLLRRDMPGQAVSSQSSGIPPGQAMGMRDFSADQWLSQENQGSRSAPLTPASFMNLPANQYSNLSGLLADHRDGVQIGPSTMPIHPETASHTQQARQGQPETTFSSSKRGSRSQPAQQQDTRMITADADVQSTQSAPTPEEMQSSIASHATAPIAPEVLAQNIKQVAAAAIAAKDAKSRSKGRASTKRRSGVQQSTQAEDDAMENSNQASDELAKKLKKESPPQNESFAALDRTFSLDDVTSAAPSIYGGSGPASTETSPVLAAQSDSRKSSHKVAEQRRRDSLKLCFEELRFILPPINPDEDEDYHGPGSRRPGENNVGGQRGKNYVVDPKHPNKGISKVAMLRKSNEYVTKLHDRVDRRDAAISMLREELRLCRVALGQGRPGDVQALDALSNVDFDELDQDQDQVSPTYRVHGLHAPGSKLSLSASTFSQPTEDTIAEEGVGSLEDSADDGDNGQDEYKAKKTKRTKKSTNRSSHNLNKATAT